MQDDGIAEPPLPNQPNSTVQLHYNDTINEDTTYYDENTTTEDSGDNSCDCGKYSGSRRMKNAQSRENKF